MRFACDTGGTFTDLIVEDSDGTLSMYKAPTTPEDPILGVLQSLKLASEDRNISLSKLLSSGSRLLQHGWHRTDADRCRSGPRLSGCRVLSRRLDETQSGICKIGDQK